MTDDPKVMPIGTGYRPEAPPPTESDVRDLQWSIVQLSEEIERLGRGQMGVTKLLELMCERLDKLMERKA